MIITNHPERVIKKIHKKLNRGVTIINGAEGAYNHEQRRFSLPSSLVQSSMISSIL